MAQPITLPGAGSPPPSPGTPLEHPDMQQWLYGVYEKTMSNGGTFPQLNVTASDQEPISFTNARFFQRLLTVTGGLYSDYTSDNGNIIYGFACNVRRSAGTTFTVAAQLNAWGARNSPGPVFGVATTAIGERGGTGGLVGIESTPLCQESTNIGNKVGCDFVFKDRFDGETTTAGGLGSNRYNYWSSGVWFTSQERSSSGENCGWNTGVFFATNSLDQVNAPNWDAATAWQAGMLVFNTFNGRYYKCISSNTNQRPDLSLTFWVVYLDNKAIGVDFSTMSTTTLARTASAIRLRDTMRIDFNSEGTIGQYFDPVALRMVLVSNLGFGASPADRVLEVDVVTGFLYRFGVFLI